MKRNEYIQIMGGRKLRKGTFPNGVNPHQKQNFSKSTSPHPYQQDDFLQLLNEQMQLLMNSMRLFDNGYLCEAKNMATRLRVLLHDSPLSTSLLAYLDKKGIQFYDTALQYEPTNKAPINSLIEFGSTSYGMDCAALLFDGTKNKKIPFEQWWGQNTVLSQIKKEFENITITKETDISQVMHNFSRKDLVLQMANKDGGAHIDPHLSEAYHELTKERDLGWVIVTNTGHEKFSTPIEYASIRQISHEIFLTLKDEFPQFPNLPLIPRPKMGVKFFNFQFSPA